MTNMISKVEMRYSVRIRKYKRNFECRNSVFGPNLNVKKATRMSKYDIGHELNNKIGIRMSKSDIRPEFE